MSTYLYLRCSAHEPPLLSVDEVGQHLSDLDRVSGWIAERDTLVAGHRDHTPGDYFLAHAVSFLAAHPHCEVDVVDEYGRTHPIEPVAPPVGTTRVLVPMLCGGRERMRNAWQQAPGSHNLTTDARIIVDATSCVAVSTSALDELVVLADLAGTTRTLYLAVNQRVGMSADEVGGPLRDRLRAHDVDPERLIEI